MYKMTATPPRPRWMMIVGFAILALLASAQQAHALPGFPSDFLGQYPQSGPTLTAAANNCTLCHTDVDTNPTNNRNAYGQDLEPAGNNTIDARLTAVELLNSDNDAAGGNACDNITEINADTLPGDPNSTPANCGVVANNPPFAVDDLPGGAAIAATPVLGEFLFMQQSASEKVRCSVNSMNSF